jgi:AcrR family transcriptional regulator
VTKPRIPAAERREQLLLTAGRLFAAAGYAGTRLDDVAAAAGVTKPIVYRHFASKKALYLALLERHERDLPGFVETDSSAGPILDVWLDYVRTNSHAWLMLFRDTSGDEEIRERRRRVNVRARQVLAGLIAARAGESGIPPEQVEPTAELLTSGLAGMALWWIDNPAAPKDVLVAAATRVAAPAVGG